MLLFSPILCLQWTSTDSWICPFPCNCVQVYKEVLESAGADLAVFAGASCHRSGWTFSC